MRKIRWQTLPTMLLPLFLKWFTRAPAIAIAGAYGLLMGFRREDRREHLKIIRQSTNRGQSHMGS